MKMDSDAILGQQRQEGRPCLCCTKLCSTCISCPLWWLNTHLNQQSDRELRQYERAVARFTYCPFAYFKDVCALPSSVTAGGGGKQNED